MFDASSPSLFTLLAALLVLVVGPFLSWLATRQKYVGPALEGFVIGAVFALVFFFLLPEAIEGGGALALLFAGLGLASLTVMERVLSMSPKRAHTLALGVGVLGLILHTVLDGFAVAGAEKTASLLGVGVIIHRLPVAVTVWWLVRPRYGKKVAWFVLLLAALSTLLGFALGGEAFAHSGGQSLALFQAFVAGTLLHVVFHGGGGLHGHGQTIFGLHIPESLGAVVGASVVALLPSLGHGHGHFEKYFERLLDLFLDSAPALLLGYFVAGLVVVFFPRAGRLWLKRGNALSQAAKGTLFGLPLPICSCGVVPVYQGLVSRGVPATAAMAFLVATPELGLESVLLSIPLLGKELTLLRLVAAFAVALILGASMFWVKTKGDSQDESENAEPQSLGRALRYGFVDVVGDTAAWIGAGLLIAAAIPEAALGTFLAGLPPGADIVLATLLAMPLYICASGATPLAAALIFAGLSPGAAVAFLLSGPATNVTTFGILSKLHGKNVALVFALFMALLAVASGFGVNALIDENTVKAAVTEHSMHGPLAMASLVFLGGLFLYAFLRQGPANFLAPVLTFGDHHGHDHGDDEDGHSHEGHSHAGHSHTHTHDDSSCCS